MSEKTKIAWCDSTLNFWSGCTKVSDGCAHCYAEALSNRFNQSEAKGHQRTKHTFGEWGKGAPRRKSKSAVKDALRFNRLPWICDNCGKPWAEPQPDKALPPCECGVDAGYHRRRIFSLSLGDWLDPEVPAEWLAEMLDTIRRCENVNWILCTKRPELWLERMTLAIGSDLRREAHGKVFNDWLSAWTRGQAPKNIIVLASVENQPAAEARIPELLRIPAACHGLSLEPLLGPVDLSKWLSPCSYYCDHDSDGGGHRPERSKIDWLIIGGES